jgi:taurine dioxygenase
MSLQVRRLSFNIGAEIVGVDLREPLDDQTFSQIHSAFLAHCVLLFRSQPITPAQHIAFTRRFGEIDSNYGSGSRFKHPEHAEVSLVFNPRLRGKPSDPLQGDRWHTDRSFTCIPPMASLLHSITIPDVGGDTQFANMYCAYEALSDGMKKLIAGLHALHVGGNNANRRERGLEVPTVAQPIVRVHPETGRKALYLGELPKSSSDGLSNSHVAKIVGMTVEESAPLIAFLCHHATRPQFVYRHVWRKDDLIMWDNRCTMHYALGDYDETQNRDMERTTVAGTPSGYIADGAHA